MDMVRYYMAMAVIVAHLNELGGFTITSLTTSFTAVGGFFALSGFLMFRTLSRNPSPAEYVRRRAMRIFPPYLFIVLACAVGLGAVSSLPAAEYYTSGAFWRYVLYNSVFMNFMQPDLPGVFDAAPHVMAAVNGSLWTLKVEWFLYLSAPLVVWACRRWRWRPVVAVVAIIVLSIAYRAAFAYMYYTTEREIYDIFGRQFLGQMSYFYTGALVYLMYDRFMAHRRAILIGAAAVALACYNWDWSGIFVSPLTCSLLVLAISFTGKWGARFSSPYNVSYEIYLYHFPLIQLGLNFGMSAWPGWLAFTVVMTAVTLLALLTMHTFEKRMCFGRPKTRAPQPGVVR